MYLAAKSDEERKDWMQAFRTGMVHGCEKGIYMSCHNSLLPSNRSYPVYTVDMSMAKLYHAIAIRAINLASKYLYIALCIP